MSFTPTGFSLEIFKDRYAFTPEETWEEACKRVAKQVALAELPEKQKTYEDKFVSILQDNLFVPGGRIWYGAGRNNPNLLNCYVVTDELDSKEGWGNLSREMIITSMMGGGVGINFSDVRPSGAEIKGTRGIAPGPLALMRLINGAAEPIRSGGSRRVALMFALDIQHPDVMEFLDAKLTRGELTYANVSVMCHDTDAFIKAVKSDADWELSWKGKYKKTIKARTLWDKVVQNAHKSAEPGFLNWQLAEAESTVSYFTKMASVNPCVTGDTPILTRRGYQRIDSLVGKKVEVWNGFEWSEVEPKITGTNQPTFRIEFNNGRTLKCTPYHKFTLAEVYYGKTIEVEAKDLKIGDKLIKHEFPIIEEGIEIPNAYLQGFYSAEGMNGYQHIDVYAPKYVCMKRLSKFGKFGKEYKELGRTHFSFEDKLKNKKYVPFEGNLKARLDWLSGLLDGDGCELKEGGVQLVSVDRTFLSDLQLMLTTLGVHSKVTLGKLAQEKDMPGGRYFCQENHRICISAEPMQKLKRLGLSCERLTLEKSPNRDASLYVAIKSIQEDEMADKVYCFNEPKKHQGIFNGIITKNCGEQILEKHGACTLGHMVLPRFVSNSQMNLPMLAETIRSSVRFLDNVLSVNTFPLPEMKANSMNLRRIGLGTTGLADTLAMLGHKYGSEEGNKFVDKLYRFISKAAYEASVMLAVEKGAFPACLPSKHIETGFLKRMPAKIRSLVAEHGIRNCAILTQAPTGTVSILSGNCSSGIEPIFASCYERRFFKGAERKTELVYHPLFSEFMKAGKSVDHFVSSQDLDPRDHMEVQAIIQKHVDSAVSKTINMAHDYPVEKMSELWLEYLPRLKGTTFYREGSRGYVDAEGNVLPPPLTAIPLEEAKKRYTQDAETGAEGSTDCPKGVCEI